MVRLLRSVHWPTNQNAEKMQHTMSHHLSTQPEVILQSPEEITTLIQNLQNNNTTSYFNDTFSLPAD